jgi:hypothetical protein
VFRRFTIAIPAPVFENLAALAEQERRPVRDQAAIILERVLRPSPSRPRPDNRRLPSLAGSGPVAV